MVAPENGDLLFVAQMLAAELKGLVSRLLPLSLNADCDSQRRGCVTAAAFLGAGFGSDHYFEPSRQACAGFLPQRSNGRNRDAYLAF
jgi:hypothetical protein